ncbi:separase/separin [Dionaea muscipula]
MVDLIKVLCLWSPVILVVATAAYLTILRKPKSVYLVDFVCYKPSCTLRAPFATIMEHSRLVLEGNTQVLNFVKRILERSGLGDETCIPPTAHYIPPNCTMGDALDEAELVIFSAMDELMRKAGVGPSEIDILIVNCSLFCPAPSLSAMVINRYKMKSNIKSFNLSGMGCSCSLISVGMARDLLQTHPNSNAVVISTEILTTNFYQGKERAMLVTSCLFRMGCAAVLLSNKPKHASQAKYQLRHLVRTHLGAGDKAYRCVSQEEDPEGRVGISLSTELMAMAGEALKKNITTIGPLVLPAAEKIRFVLSLLRRKWKPYVPDFKQAFEHFCIHAGGRAVIDELQKNLELTDEHVEASRMTLHRFGNTSSSSVWYELSYLEAKGRLRRGHRVWQIALGSGLKCNSAVWVCNRTIQPSADGPWADCIHRYPVPVNVDKLT